MRRRSASLRSRAAQLQLQLLCALGACSLLGACSFLIDTGNWQCEVDADCAARGLKGAACIQRLCQAASASPAATTAAPASLGADAAPAMRPQPDAGSAGAVMTSPRASEPARASAGASGATALGRPAANGGAGAAGRSVSGAGAGGRASAAGAGGAAAGSGSAGKCAGAVCGSECTEDADCERRGIVNGLCSAGVCYPAAAQCSSDQECEKRGPEFAGGRCLSTQCLPNPRWRCEPAPKTIDGETRDIDLPVIDGLSLDLMPDVRMQACDKRDLTCERPVTSAKTGKDGHLHLTLPTNFAGYVQQTEAAGYMPAMYFVPQSIPDDGVLDGFPLLRTGLSIDGLAATLGARIDNTRGHLILIAEDCQRKPVEGVKFSSPQQDAASVLYYVQDNLPAPGATATFAAGQGGMLNVPVGIATVTLTQAKTGLVLNAPTVLVRAGFISVAFIPPQARSH